MKTVKLIVVLTVAAAFVPTLANAQSLQANGVCGRLVGMDHGVPVYVMPTVDVAAPGAAQQTSQSQVAAQATAAGQTAQTERVAEVSTKRTHSPVRVASRRQPPNHQS